MTETVSDIETSFRAAMEREEVPGAQLCVLSEGKLVGSFTHGFSDLE